MGQNKVHSSILILIIDHLYKCPVFPSLVLLSTNYNGACAMIWQLYPFLILSAQPSLPLMSPLIRVAESGGYHHRWGGGQILFSILSTENESCPH